MPLKLSSVRWYSSKPHRRKCLPEKARRALSMRRNPTDAEAILWDELSNKRCRGVKFRRQAVLFGYIVDFFAPLIGLAVEVDGSSHLKKVDYDAQRDENLASHGISTLRITNDDVMAGRARNMVVDACDLIERSEPRGAPYSFV